MENHLKAWRAHRVFSAFYVLLLLVVGWYVYRGDGPVGPTSLLLYGALFVVLALVHGWLGTGALSRKPWARIASILIGFASLILFPIGTVLGVYLIVASWSPWTHPMTRGSPAASGWPSDAVRDRPRAGGR